MWTLENKDMLATFLLHRQSHSNKTYLQIGNVLKTCPESLVYFPMQTDNFNMIFTRPDICGFKIKENNIGDKLIMNDYKLLLC